MKNKGLPKVGGYYHFWDDGKIGASRHYICKCEEIIPIANARSVKIGDRTLIDIWAEEKKEHDWVFNNRTDYFIVCSCPKYDDDLLYFARTDDNGWFSMNTTNWWQGGVLDVEGKIYENVLKNTEEKYKELYTEVTY